MKILPNDNSYRSFCDITGGYRMFMVMSEAVNCGVIDLLEEAERTGEALLAALALEPEAGRRFIGLLVTVGLLDEYAGKLSLSRFSRTYLSSKSARSQRHVIQFEPLLLENWSKLGTMLQEGQGALLKEQSPKEYRQRFNLFQQAMGETARVRSIELWNAITLLPEQGTIIDIGAGDGTYLREFLTRHPRWHGIGCDLPDVCVSMAASARPDSLTPYPVNILETKELAALINTCRGQADLLLLSNLCHCYGPDENRTLLHQAAPLLAPEGLLVIHDFFRDVNSSGALYDLHMLVNTYNGRSYTLAETVALLQSTGFPHSTVIELPSDSVAMIASRTQPYPSGGNLTH